MSIRINDASIPENTSPAATTVIPGENVSNTDEKFQIANLHKNMTAFSGDAGAGGTKGVVPAPAAGDAAAKKSLMADGTWWNGKTYYDTIYAPIAIATKVLYDSTLGSAAASFDITSIPAGYTCLEMHYTLRHSSTGTDGAITMNADGGNNYNYQKSTFIAGTLTIADAFNQAAWFVGLSASGDSANYPTTGVLTIHNYDGTVFNKAGQIRSFRSLNDTAANQRLFDYGVLWKSTAAITRITITAQASNNFVAGSRVTLVGVK